MIDLDKIEKATGGSPEHARRVADTILNATTAEVTNPTAYVLRAIANDPDTHRPTTTPPVFKSRRATGQPFGDGAA